MKSTPPGPQSEPNSHVQTFFQNLKAEEKIYQELIAFFSFAGPDEISDYLNLTIADYFANNKMECKETSDMVYFHSKIVQFFYKMERLMAIKFKAE